MIDTNQSLAEVHYDLKIWERDDYHHTPETLCCFANLLAEKCLLHHGHLAHDLIETHIVLQKLISLPDNKGMTALHYAAAQGPNQVNALLVLLKNAASLRHENYSRLTPIDVAFQEGHVTYAFELLLTQLKKDELSLGLKHNDIEIKNNNLLPSINENLLKRVFPADKSIDLLLADPLNTYDYNPLHTLLAKSVSKKIVIPESKSLNLLLDFLKEKGMLKTADYQGKTLLHYAVELQSFLLVEKFLNYGVDQKKIDYNGRTAFHYAVGQVYPHKKIVLMLGRYADMTLKDSHDYSPLCLAIRYSQDPVIFFTLICQLYCDDLNGINFDNLRYNLSLNEHLLCKKNVEHVQIAFLFAVAASGDRDSLKNFIEVLRLDVQCRDPYDRSLLHVAHGACVEYLVQKGLNIDHQDQAGETPLIYALRLNRSVVPFLLKHQPNVNIVCHQGYCPLYYAIERGDREQVKSLLFAGAQSSPAVISLIKNIQYNEALIFCFFYFISSKNQESVLAFLKAGMPADVSDINGVTALSIAIQSEEQSLINFLYQYHAAYSCLENESLFIDAALTVFEWDDYPHTPETVLSFARLLIKKANLENNQGSENKINTHLERIVNIQDKDGLTPLSLAIQRDEKEIVAIFLQHGAFQNVFSINQKGLCCFSKSVAVESSVCLKNNKG
jgi:ankyrin repeat protein